MLKKEKLKQQLKEFEELQKTNPEEALMKLEALEKGRALERHTLRHKNTGKWAKNKLIRAKYNKAVRISVLNEYIINTGSIYNSHMDPLGFLKWKHSPDFFFISSYNCSEFAH